MRKITLSILVLLLTMVTQGTWAQQLIPWDGNGTANDPYLIKDKSGWDALALALTMQSTFYDKYFKLTNDISVTSMVSYYSVTNDEHPFMGTFDGDGHTLTVNINVESDNADTPAAPFAYLSDATIKNLNVAGSITTNGRRPASITSFVTGSSTITNCTSSVAITSSKAYDVDAGGFVGRVNTGSTLTLSNCLFTGSIAYTNATGYEGGGLVGFLQTNATANLTNCVFAPTSVSFAKTYIDFNMFANGEKNGNLDPCYINITNCFYDVSDGDHWKIAGQGGTHIPATIDNNTDWQNFGTVVTCGYDYRGKTVTLGNDVSGVSKVVGTADRPFAGTFDGQGNKLTVSINVQNNNEHTPAAPFAAISGATIKNLHVAGNISSNCYRPAGIASFVVDNSEITNCKSSVAITASRSADIDASGFVGRVNANKTITMTGCAFTGSINYTNAAGYEGGGMVGWTQTGASANLTNCLFAPTSVSFANSKSMAENNFHMIAGGIGSSTLTRCYYNNVAANNTKITQEGKQAYTISKGTGVAYVGIGGVGTTYSVSGIVVFSGGIEFNEVFYAGGDEVVNLLLTPGADPDGKHFCGYSVESGGGSIVTNLRNSATLTMADNNQIISAKWSYLASFNVTFAEGNDNEGWTIDPTFAQTFTDVTVSYAGVHKVKSVTNNVLPNVIWVDATHYKFRMPDSDTEVSTQLWYKLDEAADNSALAGKTNVFLKRTLQPGGWNTFCAPFAIADPASVFGAGVKVKQLIGASVTGNTLTLTFGNAASIAAGTPYLIKLNGEDPVDLAADGKEFEGVTQNYTAHPTTFSGVVSFVPVINPTAMTADDKTVLFVTGGNKLTHPSANANINGFRAYFQLDGSISSARSFVLDLGDGETTGIGMMSDGRGKMSDVWYDLQGRKLQGKPTTKGLYIVNGKKTIIK